MGILLLERSSRGLSREIMKSANAMTLEDLAREIGVSRSLVSIAFTGNGRIAPQTRERILQSAQEMGFSPNPHARRLASGRCQNTIGLFSLGLDFGVVTHKIKIIQGLLMDKGFDVPLYAYGAYRPSEVRRQAELMGTLRRQQPRAIICATRALEADALKELEQYRSEGGIVVCYDYCVPLDCDQVIFDREDNTYQTAKHLLELGHRHLGLYMGGATTPSGERKDGLDRALGEAGLQPNPQWMFNGETDEEGGILLAQQFLALQERPTGLCIVNDRAALSFINEVRRAGVRVPEDVSVVCHDDQPAARYSAVPLTTNTHPVQEIAAAVAALLCSRLDGSYSGTARQHIVRGALVVRDSAAPPLAEPLQGISECQNTSTHYISDNSTLKPIVVR